MKNKYYCLDLNGCEFWQFDSSCNEYKKKYFNNSNILLSTIYFCKTSGNTYKERLTGNVIIFSQSRIVCPLGVTIDINKLAPCNVETVLDSFDKLKKEGLLMEYNQILNDLFVNSNNYELENSKSSEKLLI